MILECMLKLFFIQIVSEFFPISSSLFIKTISCNSLVYANIEIIFHIFSGLTFCLIYIFHILELIKQPIKHFYKILCYITTIIPSVIVGYLVDVKHIISNDLSLKTSIILNLISGFILLGIVFWKRYNSSKNAISNNKEKNSISIKDSLGAGLLNSLNGIFPGLSRMGMSLTYLLLRNKNVEHAYTFSMISSIPVLIGKPVVLMYLDYPDSLIVFWYFIKQNYLVITVTILLIVYFHKHLKQILSYNFLIFIIILRIIYYSYYFAKHFII